ncbi:MAG: dienelactone hydrolase family protein, partial [Desulfobacteraceae bacterium]|nr:dienelactone hydrolase family protein [Desulfobacteraceae bacterium]
QAISSESDQLLLIGFSVGACAIWLLSEHEVSQNISGAVCFYGSQIRNTTDLSPKFPVKIILPKKEEHFSIKDLSSKLELKQNVRIHKSRYLHGFMNVYSKNYNQTAYNHYLQWLCNMN